MESLSRYRTVTRVIRLIEGAWYGTVIPLESETEKLAALRTSLGVARESLAAVLTQRGASALQPGDYDPTVLSPSGDQIWTGSLLRRLEDIVEARGDDLEYETTELLESHADLGIAILAIDGVLVPREQAAALAAVRIVKLDGEFQL